MCAKTFNALAEVVAVSLCEWMDGWMDGWMWVGGWMDGWMDDVDNEGKRGGGNAELPKPVGKQAGN